MRAGRLGVALALVSGCRIGGEGLKLVRNECEVDTASCGEDQAVQCDLVAGACVREAALTPYDVALRVTPAPGQGGLVERAAFPPFSLEGERSGHDLVVPEAVTVTGRVLTAGDEPRFIDAEVSFLPLSNLVGQRVVVSTQRVGSATDDPNLTVSLSPGTRYSVHIQPLTADSETLPPVDTEFDTRDGSGTFEYVYRDLGSLAGTLIDDEDEESVAGRRIRLESRGASAMEPPTVLSSTARTDAEGRFELFAQRSALQAEEYVFAVSLDPDKPWTQAVAIPPSRLGEGGTLTMPNVPERVPFVGSVEGESRVSVQAELTFVSTFEVPGAVANLNDRDWCRASLQSPPGEPYVCRARVSAFVDPGGRYRTTLLPGDYTVYIAPSATGGDLRVATRELPAVIETQPDGAAQTGLTYTLEPATVYEGLVLSSRGEPMPSVNVQALALSLRGELGEVARFNRTASAVSDASGRFELAVDSGYFDLVAIPAADSGFARVYSPNRVIASSAGATPTQLTLTPPEPVVVAGTVSGPEGPLPAAVVDAYAIVRDISGGDRAVAIGRAVADELGAYRLVLPPEVVDEADER